MKISLSFSPRLIKELSIALWKGFRVSLQQALEVAIAIATVMAEPQANGAKLHEDLDSLHLEDDEEKSAHIDGSTVKLIESRVLSLYPPIQF